MVAMNTLRPLIDRIEDVRVHTGRYTVQLEIPHESTLTERDIRSILETSSWEKDPNGSGYFEGLRAVVLRRERPIIKKGMELSGLQVSGIGYLRPSFSGSLAIMGGPLEPPSSENFISTMPGTLMTTSCARDGRLFHRRPEYRAMGTYLADELREKLVKTRQISSMGFESMAVPHVEAYGRFLDDGLSMDGQFGFMVTPAPAPGRERITSEFTSALAEWTYNRPRMRYGDLMEGFLYSVSYYMLPIGRALRELHDRGRIAHLQPHLSNFYMLSDVPYLVDWATMVHLDSNSEDNIINRSVDLMKPAGNFSGMFSQFFPIGKEFCMMVSMALTSMAMQAYSEDPTTPTDIVELSERYAGTLRRDAREADVMRLWMKEQGLERG